MVTAQLPPPEQAPVQFEKYEPAAALAVRVTTAPALNGLLTRRSATDSGGTARDGSAPRSGFRDGQREAWLETSAHGDSGIHWQEHVLLPEHAPVQLAKYEPAGRRGGEGDGGAGIIGFLTITSAIDAGRIARHGPPAPAPDVDTVSVASCPNVALTVASAIISTVHEPLPEQAPLQLAKAEPAAATGVRVTLVPPS